MGIAGIFMDRLLRKLTVRDTKKPVQNIPLRGSRPTEWA